MAYYKTADNNYSTCKFIVDPVAGQGTHQTITAALASASSGENIFIRAGTYTENPTLKAGVSLVSNQSGNVTIVGKCSATFAGSCTITGINLQTNSDYALSVTGSSATAITLNNCRITGSNNDAIEFTSSSSGSQIQLNNTVITSSNTYKNWTKTGPGPMGFDSCSIGGTSTASTHSDGALNIVSCQFTSPTSCSSTGLYNISNCIFNLAALNSTVITTAGTGTSYIYNSSFQSGSASAISIGSGTTCYISNCPVASTNTNCITGAGTVIMSPCASMLSSTAINVTTQTSQPIIFAKGASAGTVSSNAFSAYEEGTWTPVLKFGGGTTGITYTNQTASYIKIGKCVYFQLFINLSSKGSSTGTPTIDGFPYTFTGASASCFSICSLTSNITIASATAMILQPGSSGTAATLYGYQFSGASSITDTNFANNSQFRITGFYFI